MKRSITMDILTKKIEKWAKERNLHVADPKAQMLKVTEEVGEVSKALTADDIDSLSEEIGDVVVTLTILAMQSGLDINECTNIAYEKIINRKGKTINGIFIKEEDLQVGRKGITP